ncbi:phosphopantetheine-binding protein [Paenibacillus sp. MMS18-CY102]|uniref:phosphopantetheine-binding protein n=1 Tax=Paenibacillus sp. MMS18-CY102 TaxID=2682849 RepID=UPI003FA6F998
MEQDEGFSDIIAKWLVRGELRKVAEMWVKGAEVPWAQASHVTGAWRRVSLPTYPFGDSSRKDRENSQQNSVNLRNHSKEVPRASRPSEMAPTAEWLEQLSPSLAVAVADPAEAVPMVNDGHSHNQFEWAVMEAWKEVLELEHVGLHDHFQELGGDSIKITQITSRLKAVFPFDIRLNELFGAETVAQMAEMLEKEIIECISELPDEEIGKLHELI